MTDTTPTAHFTPLGKDGFAYLPLAATTSIPTDDWTPEIDYDVRDAAYSWWMQYGELEGESFADCRLRQDKALDVILASKGIVHKRER